MSYVTSGISLLQQADNEKVYFIRVLSNDQILQVRSCGNIWLNLLNYCQQH